MSYRSRMFKALLLFTLSSSLTSAEANECSESLLMPGQMSKNADEISKFELVTPSGSRGELVRYVFSPQDSARIVALMTEWNIRQNPEGYAKMNFEIKLVADLFGSARADRVIGLLEKMPSNRSDRRVRLEQVKFGIKNFFDSEVRSQGKEQHSIMTFATPEQSLLFVQAADRFGWDVSSIQLKRKYWGLDLNLTELLLRQSLRFDVEPAIVLESLRDYQSALEMREGDLSYLHFLRVLRVDTEARKSHLRRNQMIAKIERIKEKRGLGGLKIFVEGLSD